MTMTPPAATARARRFTGPRIRAVLALAVAVGLVAPASTALAAAGASTATLATAVDRAPEPSPLAFRIAAESDGVLDDGGELTLTLEVDNPGSSTVRAGGVVVSVSREPLDSRAAVADWLAGDSEPAMRRVGSTVVDSIAARGRATETTTVTPGDDLEPGVYALRGTYDSAVGELSARGVWTVADGVASGQVSVVVPITAGPRTTGLLTSEELAELTAPGGSLRAQLNAVVGTPAILAIDPAIVASIRVLGTNAPESAASWLTDLLALPHTRFALQFGDADLATQYAAGLDEPLTVDDLTPALDPAGFTVPVDGPSPSPTAGTGEPALPDIDALTDIGRARSDVFWPATGTAGADVVDALGATGTSGASSLTLVPSDSVRGERGPRATAGDAQLLVYDSDVSNALRAASDSETDADRDAALAIASAYSTFASPGEPLLVTIDRGDARTVGSLRTTVRSASRLDGRTAVGFERLLASTPASVRVDDIEPDARRVTALQRFLGSEADLTQFASILDDPQKLLAPERADILQLLGNAWLPDRAGWRDAVTAHREETAATLDAVRIVPSPDINLLGSSAPLTFSVRNDLPWPASVVLIAQPEDLRLRVQNTTEITAGENQTTRVDVPVEARVGSGESSLSLQLRSRTMIPVGEPVTVPIAVQAEWEAVGIVVVSVLVGILIVLGIIRTALRLRRRRAERGAATATNSTLKNSTGTTSAGTGSTEKTDA